MSKKEKRGINIFSSVRSFFGAHSQNKKNQPVSDPEYCANLDSLGFFCNTAESAMPIWKIYYHVRSFLDECSISGGKAVAPDGKVRKVLFVGFDGMRPDVLPCVIGGAYNETTESGGISVLRKAGGIYLGYCGGETYTSSQETTSTSACWTTQFTGVWGEKHGIKTNDGVKNLNYKTFMLSYAEKGLNTSIAFSWDQYFDVNLKEEVKYVLKNGLPMIFCDIDREKKTRLEKTRAETLELYNFTAPDKPVAALPYDIGVRDFILSRIAADDSIVCGIFDSIDSAGHRYGFGVSSEYKNAAITCDMYAKSVLNAVMDREKNNNEQWLCIFANDHGGLGRDHGRQFPEEKMTWIASNIPFDC